MTTPVETNSPLQSSPNIMSGIGNAFLEGARTFRLILLGIWLLIGSEQVRNAILVLLLLVMTYGITRIETIGRDTKTIADAMKPISDSQQIQGYLLMQELQARGIVPKQMQAIDPAKLTAPPAAPVTPAAPAVTPAPAQPTPTQAP